MKESYVRLGDVCEVQNGFAFDSKYFSSNEGEGMPLIRIRDILNGFSKTYYTSDFQEEFIVHKGDFLIGMDGDFNIGQWKSEDALLNQRVCRLIPSNKILPKFIYYYIPTALQEINNKTVYTTVKHLSSKQVKAILLPNLSISEQQRVVDILDIEFEKIDRLKSNAELNLQNAKDLFQVALAKELEPKESWGILELKDACNKITDGSHNPPKGVNKSDYRMLSSQNIQNGYLDVGKVRYLSEADFRMENTRTQAKKGDVLLTIVGTIGRTCVLKGDEGNLVFQRSVAVLSPKESVVSEYLMYTLLSLNTYLNEEANGAAQKGIYLKQLSKIEISVPSIEEQNQIIAILDNLNAKCRVLQDNYAKTIALCDDLKQALLRKAFNGEL